MKEKFIGILMKKVNGYPFAQTIQKIIKNILYNNRLNYKKYKK